MKKRTIAWLAGVVSFGTGFFLGGKMLVGMVNDCRLRMERNLSNMLVFNDWLEYIYKGNRIEQYFKDNQYSKIIIYGDGYIGSRLLQALSGTEIEIAAVMDKSFTEYTSDLCIGINSEIPEADCIVVTPIFYYDDIYKMLSEKTNIPVIPILDIMKDVTG